MSDDRLRTDARRLLKDSAHFPGDAAYQSCVKLWNGAIDKRPAVVVRPGQAADVSAGVRFARDNDLKVSVRAGGHGVAGHSLLEGGLVIDLSQQRRVQVDERNRRVVAGAGVLGADLDAATQKFGLATPMGIISHTGISGLTLGGGYGWISRRHGLAIDNLLRVDLVTADGELRRVTAESDPALFWGVRGAGAHLAVVTEFEYQLHDLGPTVLAGFVVHPRDRAQDLLHFYRDFTARSPREVTSHLLFVTGPDGVPVCLLTYLYAGPAEAGETAAAPLRKFGPPLADAIVPMPYLQAQSQFDVGAQYGRHYYWSSALASEGALSDSAIVALVEQLKQVTSPFTLVALEQLGGAIADVDEQATAYVHRKAASNLLVSSGWEPGDTPDRHVRFTRETVDRMAGYFRGGTYQNYVDDVDRFDDRAYGRNIERLRRLKQQYDPGNLFPCNGRLTPTA